MDIMLIPVNKGNVHIAYLWVYNDKIKNKITTLYESLAFNDSILISASLYSESKSFIMDIEFEKEKNGLRYTIVDEKESRITSYKPESRLKNDKIIERIDRKTYATKESYAGCVTRVYQTAKKACESDATCDTLCDFIASCHASMLAAAAYTCL
ncbi:hypothetical protein HXZ91_18015 [Myroides odoratimimus]|nr:hypothetical protein [Myroides odoratimimus]MDM1036341.1 hypothetical protein [Myroides odoratimimus]